MTHKLSQVTFHIPGDGGRATPDYMRPWTFTSDDGRFEMMIEAPFKAPPKKKTNDRRF